MGISQCQGLILAWILHITLIKVVISQDSELLPITCMWIYLSYWWTLACISFSWIWETVRCISCKSDINLNTRPNLLVVNHCGYVMLYDITLPATNDNISDWQLLIPLQSNIGPFGRVNFHCAFRESLVAFHRIRIRNAWMVQIPWYQGRTLFKVNKIVPILFCQKLE